jgi:hypothetical protein
MPQEAIACIGRAVDARHTDTQMNTYMERYIVQHLLYYYLDESRIKMI